MVLPGSHRILRGEQMSLLWPINVDGKATVDLFKKKSNLANLLKYCSLSPSQLTVGDLNGRAICCQAAD